MKLIKVLEHYHLYDGDKAIATTIVGNPMLLPNLSLKNCQAIENSYDLDELADEYFKSTNENAVLWRRIDFKAGFQKALEILGDKKFTYNQMVSAITESSISHRLPSLIIQDLQQTEWDVIIEMDTDCTGEFKYLLLDKGTPKLDADGNLILKRK